MFGFPDWVTGFWLVYLASVIGATVYCFKKW